jgi:hypothetical protein
MSDITIIVLCFVLALISPILVPCLVWLLVCICAMLAAPFISLADGVSKWLSGNKDEDN